MFRETGGGSAKKKLLIVESPSKAKTMKEILGPDFLVKASVGHIRDLVRGRGGKRALGIDVDHRYAPDYAIIEGKEKTVEELQKAASRSSAVYLASDPDREGEAIAWHIKEVLGLTDEEAKRVTCSAITPQMVREGVSHPRAIDMNLVNAQQGRRVLDRLVGFNLSPFLWKKITRNLSAGRVQSVAVKIVVIREKEIEVFQTREYWTIVATCSSTGSPIVFPAQLIRWRGERFTLGEPIASSAGSAKEIATALKKENFVVARIEEKEVKSQPRPPFITASLQQAASTHLGFRPSKTMKVAQKLYEGLDVGEGGPSGLITYMRTDSTRVTPDAITELRAYLVDRYGEAYLPSKAVFHKSKGGAQDAHEAIRPTEVKREPQALASALSKDEYRLYDLIWRRFVASQMPPARYKMTTASITAGEGQFRATGRVTVFEGHTAVMQGRNDEPSLPSLTEGETLKLEGLETTQNFTKPPPHYSEASLVKMLEKEGIGRPSTYAPVVRTIQERGYVRLEKRSFRATRLGVAVTDILQTHFPGVMDLHFTATMENDLDKVEKGTQDWVALVDSFYKPFAASLEQAIVKASPLKGKAYDGEERCPLCGANLLVRYSKQGDFLGCENYPDCKGTLPFPERTSSEEGREEEKVACPSCGDTMVKKQSRYGKMFYACPNYPTCKGSLSIGPDGSPVYPPKVEERPCRLCGSPMVVRMGKRGPFLGCSSYPKCRNILTIDKEGKAIEPPLVENETCEKCSSPMMVKMGRTGSFLGCSGYPKCRSTRPLPTTKKNKEEK